MANDNAARGLYPLNLKSQDVHYYKVDTTVNLFLGMPVELRATGLVGPAGVNTAGAVAFLGSIIGFLNGGKAGLPSNQPYLKVGDLGSDPEPYVLVADSPNQDFVIQGDTGATLATWTGVGNTFTLLYRATSGNTDSGWANLECDQSTGTTGTGGQIIWLRLLDGVNADGTVATTGNYMKMVVRIQHHQRAYGIVSPGAAV